MRKSGWREREGGRKEGRTNGKKKVECRKVNWILTVKVVVPGGNIQRGGVDEETKG